MVFPLLISRAMYFDPQHPRNLCILSFRLSVIPNECEESFPNIRKISPFGRNDTNFGTDRQARDRISIFPPRLIVFVSFA